MNRITVVDTESPGLKVSNPEADKWLSKQIQVGDKGFVRLVDYMGNDAAIVQAARVSYGAGTTTKSKDAHLINYLMANYHCYHPEMEVLTMAGWKRWDECSEYETYLVPNPVDKSLKPEYLKLETFEVNEEMITFENAKMSFSVTPNHRMWFKAKYANDYQIHIAESMSKWGSFDPGNNYKLIPTGTNLDPLGQLIGFILGDGCWSPYGAVSFHLKKERKKKYIKDCLEKLGLRFTEAQSGTHEDGSVYYIAKVDIENSGVLDYLCNNEKASEKSIKCIPETYELIAGIFDGLTNSDGSVNLRRNGRIEFTSTSCELAKLFETLGAMLGYDSHAVYTVNTETYHVNAYPKNTKTLESRRQYYSKKAYEGKVFCTTSSTGLLLVRGGSNQFSFVCGNTSPFEMCEIKLHIKMPIYCARQFFRHRTASANEYSMRYSLINDDPEVTNPSEWRSQSSDNKQGSGDFITSWPKEWLDVEGVPRYQDGPEELETLNKNHAEYPYVEDFVNHKPGDVLSALSQHSTMTAIETYNKLLAAGVAREQARSVLPVCSYTEFYWKQNLHNLFHLLRLRLDPHAQLEIREFATAIAMIVEDWVPMTYKAFEEHRMESVQFSKSAIQALRDLCTADPEFNSKLEDALETGVQSKTELRNIKSKIWSK